MHPICGCHQPDNGTCIKDGSVQAYASKKHTCDEELMTHTTHFPSIPPSPSPLQQVPWFIASIVLIIASAILFAFYILMGGHADRSMM